jgi:hypothetical protein
VAGCWRARERVATRVCGGLALQVVHAPSGVAYALKGLHKGHLIATNQVNP